MAYFTGIITKRIY